MHNGFFKRAALAFALLTVGFDAGAITISAVPNTQTVNAGDAVSVDILISDLAPGSFPPGGAPSLSEFDIDLNFDPGVLSIDTTDSNGDAVIDSVTLDPAGEMDLFGLGLNVVFADLTAPNTLNLFNLSWNLPADLDLLQSSSFILASIHFTASSSGTSLLGISINTLGDSLGLALTARIQGGSVTVAGGPSPVPIPSPFWLLLPGLAGIVVHRMRTG